MATASSLTGLAAFSLATAQVTTGNPETVVNDSAKQAEIGALIKFNGNIYRYVQYSKGTNSIAASTAAAAYWKTLTPNPAAGALPSYVVTCDTPSAVGGTPGSANMVAGVIKGVVTDTNYTWIQIAGVCTAQTTASTGAGDQIAGQSSTNLQFGRVPAFTSVFPGLQTVGVVQDSRNGTTGTNTVLLENLLW